MLTLAAATAATAQTDDEAGELNLALEPVGDQHLQVGEMHSLIVRAESRTQPAPVLSTSAMPREAVFLRNLDGSHTFMWLPMSHDVGNTVLVVKATDPTQPTRSRQTVIRLQVVENTHTGTAATIPEPTPPVTVRRVRPPQPEVVATAASGDTPSVADAEAEPAPEAEAEPKPEPEGTSVADALTKQPLADTAVNTAPAPGHEEEEEEAAAPAAVPVTTASATDTTTTGKSVEDAAAAPPDTDVSETTNSPPRLVLSTPETLRVGETFEHEFSWVDDNATDPELQVMNIPSGMSLEQFNNRALLRWIPSSQQVGQTAIIITVTDSTDRSLQDIRRLPLRVAQ